MCFEGAAQTPKKVKNWSPSRFLFIFFLLLNAFNIFTKDICWHSYDIISSSILNSYLTEKPQQQAESGFKWELPTRANSGHIGMVGKISILVRRPCEQRRGWWSGDVVAGQLPPTGNQLLVSGIGTRRSPVASLQRLQLPVKHKRSRQQASISRMTTAPHAQQCNRQPTHWEWRAFPPQAPASSFPIMWRITNWDETNLFFFF